MVSIPRKRVGREGEGVGWSDRHSNDAARREVLAGCIEGRPPSAATHLPVGKSLWTSTTAMPDISTVLLTCQVFLLSLSLPAHIREWAD